MCVECVTDQDLWTLRFHAKINRNLGNRPIFIFPCGGDEESCSSRRSLRSYLHINKDPNLENVVCLTAESLIGRPELKGLSLVKQEAILADICDWILIFVESPGSICELGIFSSLPHALKVTSAAIGKKYEHEKSFLSGGPLKEIEESSGPFNRLFYLDLSNPISCPDLQKALHELRETVNRNSAKRKMINRDVGRIDVGSLVHELLDLMQIAGPITAEDLQELYLRVKGFDGGVIRAYSGILNSDLGCEGPISYKQVIGMMKGVGLIEGEAISNSSKEYLLPMVHLDSYFMFGRTDSRDFAGMHARILLRKRKGGICCGRNAYR